MQHESTPEGRLLPDRDRREHDPLTCELCHAEGVGAELASLRAENERLREAINQLDEFVGHDGTCEIAYGGPDCTCGFDDGAYTKIRALARGESPDETDEQEAHRG